MRLEELQEGVRFHVRAAEAGAKLQLRVVPRKGALTIGADGELERTTPLIPLARLLLETTIRGASYSRDERAYSLQFTLVGELAAMDV